MSNKYKGGPTEISIGAHLISNTEKTECRKCRTELILARSGPKVRRSLFMCPCCGIGIEHIWADKPEESEVIQ